MKHLNLLFLVIFVATAIWLVNQPMEVLVQNFLLDDAFYYFQPAFNLIRGLGPTLDGEHLTNGYHPLWMGILTWIYYFFPDNKVAPIYIALIFSLVFFYFTILLFWNTLSLFTKDNFLKLVLTALLVLNPWNIANVLNGLETSLKIFLFTLFFWMFLRILFGEDQPKLFFFLGLVGGLLVLARVDYGLFLVAPTLYLFWWLNAQASPENAMRFIGQRASYFFLPAILLPLPWFLYNKIYFGSFFPTSGLAYTLINHQLFFYKARTTLTIFLWSLYNFFGAVAFSLKTAGLPVFYDIRESLKSIFWMGGLYIVTPALIISYFYWKARENFKKFLKELFGSPEFIALLFFLVGYLGLLIVHGGIRWSSREWYFAPFPMLFLFGSGIVLNQCLFYRKLILVGMSAVLIFFYISNAQAVFYANEGQKEVYQLALWLKDNFPPEARIASFNSGILGYFSDRFVMNSDGLINQSAYEAMKENRLWEFFKKERIDYIVDYEVTLTYRFKSFFGIEDPMAKVVKIDLPNYLSKVGTYGGSQVKVYKLQYEK